MGFQRELPGLVGYQRSARLFVAFNLIWLSMLTLAALGVFLRIPLADLLVFFVAIGAGVVNGIGHLALSLMERGYFPGTLSAPVGLIGGVVLFARLLRRTEPGNSVHGYVPIWRPWRKSAEVKVRES